MIISSKKVTEMFQYLIYTENTQITIINKIERQYEIYV